MKKRTPQITRNVSILHSIVRAYIETGEPVASRTVARRLRDNLSPASVRNIMADLYEEGYLSQPHTSAGRIPTEKAFQSYVSSLAERRILDSELQRLKHELGEIDTLPGRVERSSHILVELTRGFGIAAAIPAASQILDQVDLLTLADRRVLMVVVTRDHIVRNRVVALSEPVSQDELAAIRNYLNANFSGWVLSDVQRELKRRLAHDSAAYDAMLKKLNVLYEKGLLEVELHPEIHVEGASNLVGLDLHLTREKLRELFRALEQKKKVLLLLDRFLEQPQGEIGVQIGLAEVHPTMGELSLIGVSVVLPNGLSGKIAVLGPMRMNYEKVMSAVLHVGQALQSIPA
ncbi:MAG: heat-inducible transcriptional repressor HrcA [Bryobacteraceae bacterium]